MRRAVLVRGLHRYSPTTGCGPFEGLLDQDGAGPTQLVHARADRQGKLAALQLDGPAVYTGDNLGRAEPRSRRDDIDLTGEARPEDLRDRSIRGCRTVAVLRVDSFGTYNKPGTTALTSRRHTRPGVVVQLGIGVGLRAC